MHHLSYAQSMKEQQLLLFLCADCTISECKYNAEQYSLLQTLLWLRIGLSRLHEKKKSYPYEEEKKVIIFEVKTKY